MLKIVIALSENRKIEKVNLSWNFLNVHKNLNGES